jgi:hypothetical protein
MAIACILIFKDQVESAQVITFIRNRRYVHYCLTQTFAFYSVSAKL